MSAVSPRGAATTDVVVVGGGITGLSSAYELARAGCAVTLLEARRVAAMASGWTLGGVRQSGRHPAELPLAQAAVARWGGLDEELGAPTGYVRRGNLRLARTPAEVETIRALVETQRGLGLDLDFLPDPAAVRAAAPAIGPSVLAASFCPGDGAAEPDLACAAYAAAARRHGATLREGASATAILHRGGRVVGVSTDHGGAISCDAVVVATGVEAPRLLAPFEVDFPIQTKRVCVLRTTPGPRLFDQVFGVANADCAGRQEQSGRLRVTTGVGDWDGDVAGWTRETLLPSVTATVDLISRVSAILPGLGALGFDQLWGGMIDLSPDGLPTIDRAGPSGLVAAAGFSGHGFGIGPVVGEIVRGLVLSEAPAFDLAPFRAGRFGENAPHAPLELHG